MKTHSVDGFTAIAVRTSRGGKRTIRRSACRTREDLALGDLTDSKSVIDA